MSQQLSIKQQVEELQNIIRRSSIYFDVLSVYQEKKYSKILTSYPFFLIATQEALKSALFIELHKLFDKNRKTINIPRLIITLKSNGSLSSGSEEKIQDLLDKFAQFQEKIMKIRNNYLAHRTKRRLSKTFSQQVSIKHPQEIKNYLEICKKIIDHLSIAHDNSYDASHWSARKDTTRLLENIASG